jgi:hypothetical protein
MLQQRRDSNVASHGEENGETIDRVIALGGEVWLSLVRWARETASLDAAQLSIASLLARKINNSRRPSARQAAEGEVVLATARKMGFRIPELQTM